jgi:hypothetical protein
MKIHWIIILLSFICLAILVNLVMLDIRVFSPAPDIKPLVITKTIEIPVTPMPAPSPVTQIIEKQIISTPPTQVKESFIPFGSGTTQNDQWEDITGAEAYIDTNNYSNMQTVYFEVSLHIPTKNGIAYARLYDVTDKHPVWFSDVSTTSDTSQLVSAKIKLDKGNKHYRVQMKTTLRYPTSLDMARVKIITK